MRAKCRVRGCPRLARSRGLCNPDYMKWRRTGKYDDLILPPRSGPYLQPEPIECVCEVPDPDPDPIHECRSCHRPRFPPGYVETLTSRRLAAVGAVTS